MRERGVRNLIILLTVDLSLRGEFTLLSLLATLAVLGGGRGGGCGELTFGFVGNLGGELLLLSRIARPTLVLRFMGRPFITLSKFKRFLYGIPNTYPNPVSL